MIPFGLQPMAWAADAPLPSTGTPPAGAYAWWTALQGVNTGASDVWVDRVAGYTFSQATATSRPTATVVGGVTCLAFDGSDDSLVSAAIHSFNGLSALTIQMLVSADLADDGDIYLGRSVLSIAETGSWGLLAINARQNMVRWEFGTGQANNLPSQSFSSRGTGWFLLTIVKSGVTETVYLNGTQIYSASTFMLTLSQGGSTITLGKNAGGSTTWAGRIAELLVYKSALSAAGVAANVAFFSTRHALSLP